MLGTVFKSMFDLSFSCLQTSPDEINVESRLDMTGSKDTAD